MQSPSSLYHDVIFPGGIKTTERGEIDNWPDIANMTSGGVIDADAEFAANRAHPTFDDFWRERSFIDCLDTVTVPVLAIGGWNDMYFRSGTHRQHRGPAGADLGDLRPVAPLLPGGAGRGRRGREPNEERRRALSEIPQMPPGVLLAWFDHWLAGLPDVPVPAEPTFTSFEGPVGVGAGWCELDGWDAGGATGTDLELPPDGACRSASPPRRTTRSTR